MHRTPLELAHEHGHHLADVITTRRGWNTRASCRCGYTTRPYAAPAAALATLAHHLERVAATLRTNGLA